MTMIKRTNSSCHRFSFISLALMSFAGLLLLLVFYYFSEFYNVSDTYIFQRGSIVGRNEHEDRYFSLLFSKGNRTGGHHRKLLASSLVNDGVSNRISGLCSKDDIAVYQGPMNPLPNGIPTYTVQILNVCVSGCSISNIHVSCGWFSSARMINPRVFRRLNYDDCLVNNGEALGPGESLSFQYADSFRYPLSVSSVTC